MRILRTIITGGLFAAAAAWTLPVHSAAPLLRIQRETTNVVVNFTGRLETASRGEGPYTNVLAATSPHIWPAESGKSRFWRSFMEVGRLAAGGWHTVVVKHDGILLAWGSNGWGPLGVGSAMTGTNQPVRVGTDSDWRSVACGAYHTLAIKNDGTLWAWGLNHQGQLGIGSDLDKSQPVRVGTDTNWVVAGGGLHYTMALKADGTLWRWGVGIHQPVQVGVESDWVAIACGNGHGLALKSNGSLFAWGLNDQGQLGIGGDVDRTDEFVRVGDATDWIAVAGGDNHTLGLKADGSLWAWGANHRGELGIGSYSSTNQPTPIPGPSNWTAVGAGGAHSVALKGDGTLWSWGSNEYAQLGIGSDVFRTNQPARIGTDTDWRALACGGDPNLAEGVLGHNLALKDDGSLWTWGSGAEGQLGLGTYTRTNHPVRLGSDNDWAP